MNIEQNIPKEYLGRPYYALDSYLKGRFGKKIYKISLDGGMSCPNRDGTLGTGGCTFCSAGGSGDFAQKRENAADIRKQIELAKKQVERKCAGPYIAYFQSYTNTYARVEYLEELFTRAINHPDVVGLSIGTRPDCLEQEKIELLKRLNQVKPVWVELGLQTMHEDTAKFIRRGYDLKCFEQAVAALRKRGIEVIVHVILGLPGEDEKRMLQTVEYLSGLDIQGIKLQLLHILEGTDLGELYRMGKVPVMTMEEYIDIVTECLEHLSPEITVHRLTGDGPGKLLLAPLWSSRKRTVLNTIHSRMKERGSFQGKQILREES